MSRLLFFTVKIYCWPLEVLSYSIQLTLDRIRSICSTWDNYYKNINDDWSLLLRRSFWQRHVLLTAICFALTCVWSETVKKISADTSSSRYCLQHWAFCDKRPVTSMVMRAAVSFVSGFVSISVTNYIEETYKCFANPGISSTHTMYVLY